MKSIFKPEDWATESSFLKDAAGGQPVNDDMVARLKVKLVKQVLDSHLFFMRNYAQTVDKHTSELVLMDPFYGQAGLDYTIECQRRAGYAQRVVEIKPRQVGWTTALLSRGVWTCLHPRRNTVLFVPDSEVAEDMMRRVGTIINCLPDWLRPMKRIDRTGLIEFDNPNHRERERDPGLQSRFLCLVPTDFRGASNINMVILSEYAKYNKTMHGGVQEFLDALMSGIAESDNTCVVIDTTPCIAVGSMVNTNNGAVAIEQLETGIGIKTSFGKIKRFLDKGSRPVVQVRTRRGLTLNCTPDHRLLTTEGWCQASNSIGKRVVLEPIKFGKKVQNVAGIEIDEDWGRLLGYFVGDGSCYARTGHISFAAYLGDLDIVKDIKRLMLRCLCSFERVNYKWLKEVVYEQIVGQCSHMAMTRVSAVEFLDELGVIENQKRKITVPQVIFDSPKNIVREFVRGLFEADGHSHRHTTQVCLTAKNHAFLEQVLLLLSGFGIAASIRKHDTAWRIVIAARYSKIFNRDIGFISKRKIKKSEYHEKFRPYRRKPDVDHLDWDNVVSVQDAGVADVYDLMIDGKPKFVANGIVVHNCGHDNFYEPMAMEAISRNSQWVKRWFKKGRRTVQEVADGALGTPDRPQDWVPFFSRWIDHDRYTTKDDLITGELPALTPLAIDELLKSERKIGSREEYGNDKEEELIKKHGATLGNIAWRRNKIDKNPGPDFRYRLLGFEQEFCVDFNECFVTYGTTPFDPLGLEAIHKQVMDPYAVGIMRDGPNGPYLDTTFRSDWQEVRLWTNPQPGEAFLIAVDLGRAYQTKDADDSFAHVLRRHDQKQCAVYQAKVPPTELRVQLNLLYKYYNNALLVVETDEGVGYSLVRELYDMGCTNQYYWTRLDRDIPNPTDYIGWETNPKTRPIMQETLVEEVNRRGPDGKPMPGVIIRDYETYRQLTNLERNPSGMIEGSGKTHDDAAVSLMFALASNRSPWHAFAAPKQASEEVDPKTRGGALMSDYVNPKQDSSKMYVEPGVGRDEKESGDAA